MAVAGLTGCSPAMPPPDSTPRARFEWSVDRYDRAKYHDAIRGLRDHLFRDPLHPTTDSSRYLLAESYLQTGDELLAANEFRQLASSRPNSPLADDAQFGTCRSYWAISPKLERDQEFTGMTIEECTRLLEFYPRSPLVPEAREIVLEARQKLAAKNYQVGKFYYDRRMYESSIIYLEAIMREFPEAEVAPQVLYLLHDSYAQVGFRAEAEATRQYLMQTYPDSQEAKRLSDAAGSAGM
jgi:outer membrane protein assembly factor BamD